VESGEWRVERGWVAGALVRGRPWERGRGERRKGRGVATFSIYTRDLFLTGSVWSG